MMFLEGYMGAPPTLTVFSVAILPCAKEAFIRKAATSNNVNDFICFIKEFLKIFVCDFQIALVSRSGCACVQRIQIRIVIKSWIAGQEIFLRRKINCNFENQQRVFFVNNNFFRQEMQVEEA
jgi:hypothetical protein